MIGFGTDHSGLNKFTDSHDPNFAKLRYEIDKMIRAGESVVTEQRRKLGMGTSGCIRFSSGI
jgi:hypothetical protein